MSSPRNDTVHPPLSHCPNCGQNLRFDPSPHWCPHCGQETRLHPPTLWEFLHEFVGHYIAAEGALWRTLWALLLLPGQLTLEYLRGRRRRYVLPLRLYLTASFCFFLLVKVGGLGDGVQVNATLQTPLEQSLMVTTDGDGREETMPQFIQRCQATENTCGSLERRLARTAQRLTRSDDPVGDFGRRMLGVAPYAVFLMLPLFAGVLQLCSRGAGAATAALGSGNGTGSLPYGAHYVFGLHLHALWFLVLLLLAAVPEGWGGPVLGVLWLHGVIAMRRVLGLGWSGALWRALGVTLLYGLLLVLGTGALTAGVLLL